MQQHQVLKLTGIIIPGFKSGIYVGWIKELEGINVQGSSVDDAFTKLKSATKVMLGYKDKDTAARQLLAERLGTSLDEITNVILDPEVELA